MQNRITLKAIKRSAFASQETHCYQAAVYFDGKKVAMASNDGHGGCDSYYPTDRKGFEAMQEYVKTLPPIEYNGVELTRDLESICGELVNQWLQRQDLLKLMRKKAVFLLGEEVFTTQYKGSRKPDGSLYDHVEKRYPGAKILNRMPVDDAVKLYVGAAQ